MINNATLCKSIEIFKWEIRYVDEKVLNQDLTDSATNLDFVFTCLMDSAYLPIDIGIFDPSISMTEPYKFLFYNNYFF